MTPEAGPDPWAAVDLDEVARRARSYLTSLPERPVGARPVRPDPVLAADPVAADQVVAELCELVGPGLVASAGPRYFGFVTGGALPAALAADWLTSTWDQNAALAAMSPAAAAVEEVVVAWVVDLLGLGEGVVGGLATGAQMATTTALAVARDVVCERQGVDVAETGLAGAPPIAVVVGAERHATVDRSVRLLGFGTSHLMVVPSDDQGRLVPAALARLLDSLDRPAIVVAQAGNVNSGASDPIAEVVDIAAGHEAWVHLDGAFGLWARAVPERRASLDGIERCDSWATDGHKWLNVPYDCGIVLSRHPEAHRRCHSLTAAYLPAAGSRDGSEFVVEASRRARGFPMWAALRSLGRSGVADLVDRCCRLADRLAAGLEVVDGVTVCNEVVLNQVVVRFGDDDELTHRVIAAVQADGTCWAGGTVWQGRAAMRLSVSNWSTTVDDVDRSLAAIVGSWRAVAAA